MGNYVFGNLRKIKFSPTSCTFSTFFVILNNFDRNVKWFHQRRENIWCLSNSTFFLKHKSAYLPNPFYFLAVYFQFKLCYQVRFSSLIYTTIGIQGCSLKGHLVFKSSKTNHFIMKSYFYKILMTSWSRFLNKKKISLQPQKKNRGCFFRCKYQKFTWKSKNVSATLDLKVVHWSKNISFIQSDLRYNLR